MNFARFSVTRPVAVTMRIAALVLLGAICATRLPIDLLCGGRLVLTGRVRTGAEKDLAGVVARDAASAAVENNVIVQP